MATAGGLVLTFNRQVIDVSSNGMIGESTVYKKLVPGSITFTCNYDPEEEVLLRNLLARDIAEMYRRDV